MKKSIILLTALFITLTSLAQQGINYKAILKDGSGNLLAGTFMNVQFTIHETTETGTIVYQEDHNYTTDANGLLIHNIGSEPSPSIGVFADIDWGADKHFLQVTIAYSGGTVNFDATEFMAVPYAKHAESATFKTENNVTSNSPGNLVADNLVFGSTQMNDDNTTADDNARVFFNKAKGAFRAGLVDDTYWDDAEVGSYSVSMGLNTKAKGQNSFAMGGNSTAIGKDAVAMGGIATATGQNAISIGNQTNANGLTSVALGAGTTTNGFYSTAMNLSTTADALASTAMGRNNIGTGDPGNWIETDPLFEIGNSIDSNNKTNALTVLKNGTITAPSFDISEITDAKALITKEYLESNGSTGLKQITQNNGTQDNTGWRLQGVNQGYYGPIGEEAVDLSYSPFSIPSSLGATGYRSFAVGYGAKASESYAMAIRGIATGSSSLAIGGTASGAYSKSFGGIATGVYSVTLGSYVRAESYNSFALGRNNIGGGYAGDPDDVNAASNWVLTDPLFEIGNGTSNSAKNNALTVLKNGNATFDGKIQHTSTGTANMIPIAYGIVESNGNVRADTGNFIAEVDSGVFTIDVNGEDLSYDDTICIVTPISSASRSSGTLIADGNIDGDSDIIVRIFNASGALAATTFQFVIYKL